MPISGGQEPSRCSSLPSLVSISAMSVRPAIGGGGPEPRAVLKQPGDQHQLREDVYALPSAPVVAASGVACRTARLTCDGAGRAGDPAGVNVGGLADDPRRGWADV